MEKDRLNEKTAKEETVKMVSIRLPRERGNNEDVFVSVNNRNYLIQRGVKVEVPWFVYEVLQHQEEMLEQIILFDEKNSQKEAE